MGQTSVIPGRTLHFERKLQNSYINKALHVSNPQTESVKAHRQLYDGSHSDRLHHPIQAAEDSSAKMSSPSQKQNPFELLRQSQDLNNPYKNNSLNLQNPTYGYNNGFKSQTPQADGTFIRKSATNLSATPTYQRDYLQTKGKNGSNSNQYNIITNQYR